MRRELDKLLAAVGEASNDELVWDATELAQIELIMCAIDRKVALNEALSSAPDTKAYCKLAAELRLTEGHIARLVRAVRPEMPKESTATPTTPRASNRGAKARAAANARWQVG